MTVIFLAGILRMGLYGYKYYPLLDDYIQLQVYPQVKGIYFTLELYRQRPLAALFDIYVWSINQDLSFFIITLLHCASAYILIKVFNKCGFKTCLLFAVVFLLCPLNIEAAYWISASGRIVTSVFLAAFAAYFLCSEKMFLYYIFFIPSLLFYEQTAVFSFLLSLTVIINRKNYGKICNLFFIGCLYFSYYLSFATGGPFGSRGETGINFTVLKTFAYMLSLWGKIGTVGTGFLILTAAVSLMFCKDKGQPSLKGFLWGFIYAFFGIIMFVFLKNPTIGFRMLFVPVIGFSLMLDSIFSQKWRRVLAPVLAAVFILTSASDLSYYRDNYFYDRQIIKTVAANITEEKCYTVCGLKERNVRTGKDFAQFIQGVCSSDWALTGAVRAYLNNPDFPYFKVAD